MLFWEKPEHCADRGFMRYFSGKLRWYLVDFLVRPWDEWGPINTDDGTGNVDACTCTA